ncbi:hypothetical protein F5984_06905 [Rudanella paleaurantiibacter]|uniref:T9SS type A sorting domain-containing protein n=1 Tax=Rudanella paleaurantiibacter TaxID=2614655 RepID=A0A7J5U376_9BACT|nr:hypothetical protein [Rudanella paleaurantiibacter]KAB7731942.1 hypothetical protein F5984_06905 [Rudanella paleaurantiibacter]
MRLYLLIICLLTVGRLLAQTPFTARWSFDGNTAGSSSSPYISVGNAGFVGVAPANFGPYVPGVAGQAINVDNWSPSMCNRAEYVSITLQPNQGQTMTLNQLSFYFSRSLAGPVTVSVRSSADNFGNDIYTGTATESFQQAVVGLSGGAYANQSGPVTFRIYGCPPQGSGTLRLDELTISGTVTVTPLPVSLLYFRAQALPDNRVQLSWATTWERDADRFEIQRSRTLAEFGTVGQLPARGTTDARQFYTFTDDWPDAGTTYYRLRQVDRNGTAHLSEIVAVVLDDRTPSLVVLDTGGPGIIALKGRNLGGAVWSVWSAAGVPVPVTARSGPDGRTELSGLFGGGVYLIRADGADWRLTQRVWVR